MTTFSVCLIGQHPNSTGDPLPRSDTYYTTSAGISFDVPYSRQRFQGGYTWNQTKYDRYSNLDFTGHVGKLLWLWQVGNDASGQIGYTDVTAPQTFAYVQGRATDVLRTKQLFAKGAYLITPSWRLEGGANGYEQTTKVEEARFNNINLGTAEAAFSYVSPANNSVGLGFSWPGRPFSDRDTLIGTRLPQSYRQYDTGAIFEWTVTGKSKLTGRAEYAQRRWDDFSQLDWSGFVGRLQYDWRPTGKVSVTTLLRREINPYEDSQANFTLIKSITLIPTWNASDKIDVTAAFDSANATT